MLMPNHITNIIKLEGDRLHIQKLLEAIYIEEYGLGTVDFNKVIPMPESLDIESGSATKRAMKAYDDFMSAFKILNGADADPNMIPEESEKAFAEYRDLSPEEWQLGKTAYWNNVQYGFSDWYDWRRANWGTKWNSYGYDEHDDYSNKDRVKFLTAWAAPHPVISKLAKMFPEVEIEHEWADEDIGSNCGRRVYYDGECVEEYYPEIERERFEFAARVLDIDLERDYGLYLNATETGYVYILGDNDLELIELAGQTAGFTRFRITDADIAKGMYCYHFRDDGAGNICALEKNVKVNHAGTVIAKAPIDLGEQGYISLEGDDYPNFLGETISMHEFYDPGSDETEDVGIKSDDISL